MGNCSSDAKSQVSNMNGLGSSRRSVKSSHSSTQNSSSRNSQSIQKQMSDSSHTSMQLSAESQSRWQHTLQKYQDDIIDPQDVHTVLESSLSSCINQLQSAETTLILRRVRKVVSELASEEKPRGTSLGYSKKKVPMDDLSKSRSIYQKEGLLDANVFRSIFIAGDRWLNRGAMERWVKTSLTQYETRMNKNLPRIVEDHIVHDLHGGEKSSSKAITHGQPGDLIDAAYTLLLHLAESRWDHAQAIAVYSAERAGLVLDVNKKILSQGKKQSRDVMDPPVLNPFAEADVPSPTLENGVTFESIALLMSFSLRCSRLQRLNLLFHLLLGSDRLTSLLKEHPAGGVPSWIIECEQDWKLSYGSLGHDFYYKTSLKINARVAIETIAILLQFCPPQDLEEEHHDEHLAPRRRKRTLSYGDKKYHKAKMHVMLAGYLRKVRSGKDAPTFETEEERDARRRVLDIFWDASADTYKRMEKQGSKITYWTLHDFISWTKKSIPDDATIDIIMHQIFGMGLLPTPAMERKLVKESWVEWQNRERHLFSGTSDGDFGAIHAMTNGIRNFLSFSSRENDAESEPPSPVLIDENFDINGSSVWGGIGGFDGKGGLGNGIMYCIDKKWWNKWTSYVGWQWQGEKQDNITRSRRRPNELSTEELLDRTSDKLIGGSMGSYELMKKNLQKDKDFILVPPCVWDILYELYAGGPPLPRMILRRSADNSSIDLPNDQEFAIPNRIPRTLQVLLHPWIIECHVCDPHQPYRRGDVGPMSIRIMSSPTQPLWRLFAEIVLRLPIVHPRGKDSDGKGRGRLWKHIEDEELMDNEGKSVSRFGPWQLLINEGAAEFPVGESMDMDHVAYSSFVTSWETYIHDITVGGAGLEDGARLMFEYALLGRDGNFIWPREAAEKAGIQQRDSAEDIEFRLFLRGLDPSGNLIKDPKASIVGTVIDAMDGAGRWFQAEIADIDFQKDSNDDSDDENEESKSSEKDVQKEIRAVKIDFRDIGGHEQWIVVSSDRLAVKGRFTRDSMKSIRLEEMENPGNGKQSNGESKRLSFVLKGNASKEATPFQIGSSICPFPGFGACGLANLGNTCYANSAIQCISYMPLLRSYLVSGHFKKFNEINKDNPLGTGGKLLEEFASLQQLMWNAKIGVRSPSKFRAQLSRNLSQYAGTEQQDAQELLNDLLDALHEDCNKVQKKPYVEALEDNFVEHNPLSLVGEESWRRFLRRNRSVIANIGMGQVLNRVTCPTCNHTSLNFDPFNMLSIPFPVVSEVVFKCKVLRRATPQCCPRTLGARNEKKIKGNTENRIIQEYSIRISRLADISELKEKIQELCEIPVERLTFFVDIDTSSDKKEELSPRNNGNGISLSAIPEKEGPCLQFAKEVTEGKFASPSETPTLIVAFESTLHERVINTDAVPAATEQAAVDREKSTKLANEELKLYGGPDECRLCDSKPTNLTKDITRSIWPMSIENLLVGTRVDAIDKGGQWFPGSIIRIDQDKLESGAVKENDKVMTVHFDNFDDKWDLEYSFSDVTGGKVLPIYTKCKPKEKPQEFLVYHSTVDETDSYFSYPFMIQFYHDWSTARAGAHLLSQASRFLEKSSEDIGIEMKDFELNKISRECRNAIAKTIDLLLEEDKDFMRVLLSSSASGKNIPKAISSLKEQQKKKLSDLLGRLPFDLYIHRKVDGVTNHIEKIKPFEFELDVSIGNLLDARNKIILRWKRFGRSSETIFFEPIDKSVKPDPEEIKRKEEAANLAAMYSNDGLRLSACLDEFCKEQSLEETDCWRCPKCKDFRAGKQSMTLWRLPDLLTFHLKRFNCSARWREKITTKVNFPLTGLDMKKWVDTSSPTIDIDGSIYDLIGVVNHYGGMTGGHYVAACKVTSCSPEGSEEVEHNFNGAGVHAFGTKEKITQTATWKLGRSKDKDSSDLQSRAALSASKTAAESSEPLWLQFDDDTVEPLPPRSVNAESAYVLFYRRRQITPVNIARYSALD